MNTTNFANAAMYSQRHVLLLLFVWLFCAHSSQGQVTTGLPPFGSFSGGPDIVNNANGNVHITIPVFSRPGRGTPFSYALQYDSSFWTPYGAGGFYGAWGIAGGWTASSAAETGRYNFTQVQACCPGQHCNPDLGTGTYYNKYSGWVYIDRNGTQHNFPMSVNDSSQLCPYGTGSWSATGGTSDGSGLTMTVDATPEATFVYDIHGNTFDLQNSIVKDRNGNEISGNYTIADTLSSTTPALTISTSGNPITYTYIAPSGQQAILKYKYQSFTVRTNFACSGVTEYGPSALNLVTEIDLPDWNATTNPNSKYTFTYEATPGYSGDVTGRLASITFPTGGTITYSYSGGNNGIICGDGSTPTLTRITPDGSWTYARSGGTLITDPQGNQTNVNFQGIYETERQIYQKVNGIQTLLKTVFTCYNGAAPNCNNTAISLPITQRAVYTQWPSGLESEMNVFYNGLGLPTEEDDYDYGSGSPGALLRKTLMPYATLGNYIADKLASVTVQNASGTTVAQTTYAYDETTPVSTSGTPQHVSVSGSRGNATTIKNLVQGTSAFLTSTVSYYDTGNPQTITDVNNAATTYNYPDATSTCGNSFPKSVTEPLSLSRSMTWNCSGGVQLTAVDENNQTTTATFNDPYFWRSAYITDQSGAVTNFCYGVISSGTCSLNPNQVESVLTFNSGNSTVDTLTTLDGLGRTHVQQTRQSPTASTFDSIEADYDSLGRVNRLTLPFSGTAGQTNSSAPGTLTTYDALDRTVTVTDGGNGTATYLYTQNDASLTIGPAPTGENTKRRQLEYNGLGQLTSVCELTSATGSGTCAQTTSQTGYWTKYVYDPLGNLTGVTQNAQSTGSQQNRSYSFDGLRRLTSETNPESGTKNYVYDSDSTMCGNGAYTSNGDLLKTTDAAGNCVMLYYDALHRLTDVGSPSGCKRFRYDNTNGVLGAKPSGVTISNPYGRLAEAETDTCAWPITQSSIITDEWFGYTARGEVSDIYDSTLHSGGYYHVAQTYWPHGAPSQLSGNIGLPTVTYGVDTEGRLTTSSASSGQNPVTSTSYNLYTSPPQLQVTFGSGDSDTFSFDANTGRMTQYKFTVGNSPQSVVGNLSWNANGSLGQHAITDPFNSANTQTCNFQHDDLSRISQADCGSGGWGQSFTYDPFGNITKNVLSNHTGNSFQPTYSSSTNRMTALPGFTPTYDSNGNVLNDNSHQYSPDAEGRPVTLDTISLTFDALNRMVEQHSGSSYTEIAYAPTGEKLALMNSQTLQKAFVPLPGGAVAVYTSSGLDHYRHSDWLGNARLTSTTSRTVSGDTAYAPFGETYAQSGTPDISLTGQNPDTSGSLYDFLLREYSTQGRWPAPDPAGLAAVNPAVPQSWNRYAYVLNSPLALVDSMGLGPCDTFISCVILLPPPPGKGGSSGVGGSSGGGTSGCLLFMPPELEDPERALMGDEDLELEQSQGTCNHSGNSGGGSAMRAPKPPPCVMQDELAGSLDVKFLLGLQGQFATPVGKADVGFSLYKSVVTGDTGAQMAVQAGAGISADRPTPPGGSITGGAEPANVVVNLGPLQKNLTTGQSGLMIDKLFKLGGALGVGGEVDFNLSAFWQIHKQNDACRLKLASWHP